VIQVFYWILENRKLGSSKGSANECFFLKTPIRKHLNVTFIGVKMVFHKSYEIMAGKRIETRLFICFL